MKQKGMAGSNPTWKGHSRPYIRPTWNLRSRQKIKVVTVLRHCSSSNRRKRRFKQGSTMRIRAEMPCTTPKLRRFPQPSFSSGSAPRRWVEVRQPGHCRLDHALRYEETFLTFIFKGHELRHGRRHGSQSHVDVAVHWKADHFFDPARI